MGTARDMTWREGGEIRSNTMCKSTWITGGRDECAQLYQLFSFSGLPKIYPFVIIHLIIKSVWTKEHSPHTNHLERWSYEMRARDWMMNSLLSKDCQCSQCYYHKSWRGDSWGTIDTGWSTSHTSHTGHTSWHTSGSRTDTVGGGDLTGVGTVGSTSGRIGSKCG